MPFEPRELVARRPAEVLEVDVAGLGADELGVVLGVDDDRDLVGRRPAREAVARDVVVVGLEAHELLVAVLGHLVRTGADEQLGVDVEVLVAGEGRALVRVLRGDEDHARRTSP